MTEIEINQLFDMEHTIAGSIFEDATYPYEVLPEISDYILELG